MIPRTWGLATVVVVSLAIGIGMNTVVFSWIQARVLRPLPGVPDGGALQLIEPRTETGGFPGLSWLEYQDVRQRVDAFRDILAYRIIPVYLGESGSVERAYGMLVSDNYFTALGLRPEAGRFFTAEDVRPGAAPVAIVSYGLWQSRVLTPGQTLRLNARDVTVIGVAPRAFQGTIFGLNFDVWVPAVAAPAILNGSRELDDRRIRGYSAMGRLRRETSKAQAQQQLTALMTDLARTYPETNATVRGEVLDFWESARGPERLLMPALAILQALMVLLLLAVCGNTANLVLARASARQREIAVRLAIGAAPWRIASLVLTENVLLALAGAILAIPIAMWGNRAFQLLPITGMPVRFQTSVDIAGLAFAMTLGVVCGIIFGAAPAVQLARVDPQLVFRSGSRTAGRSTLRNALMGIQVGLALVVLVSAGLFLRSFQATRDTDPGFKREGVILAAYDLGGRGGAPAARAFARTALDRIRALPGVQGAAIAASVPLDIHGLPSRSFRVDGHTRVEPGADQALANTVTPGYFAVMGIPLRRGTDFADLQDPSAPAQAVVNEAFIHRYLGELEPLGRKLETRGRSVIITGVVRDSLYNAFGESPTPIIYLSYRDNPSGLGEIHVRTAAGAEHASVAAIRGVVREIDPETPIFNVRSLWDHVETNLVFRRVPARMFAVLGPLLLILAAIGIYAVVAYTISQRATEIGVRLAVGASPQRVIVQMMGQSLTVIGIGALIGWAVALVIAMDVGAGTIDVPVFAGVPLLLMLVAVFACWLPARRVTRVDPVVALRNS